MDRVARASTGYHDRRLGTNEAPARSTIVEKPVLTSAGPEDQSLSTDTAGNPESATRGRPTSIRRAAPRRHRDVPSATSNNDVTVTLDQLSDHRRLGRRQKNLHTTRRIGTDELQADLTLGEHAVLTSVRPEIRTSSADTAGATKRAALRDAPVIDRVAPTTTDDVPAASVNHDVTLTLTAER